MQIQEVIKTFFAGKPLGNAEQLADVESRFGRLDPVFREYCSTAGQLEEGARALL